MSEDKEVEIKVQIESSRKLIAFLNKHGRFIGKKHQLDRYFVPAHRDFLKVRPVKEWLRLRESEGKYSLSYKNWYFDKNGRSHYCDEYETAIESLDQLEKIFKSLNLKEVVTVDKVRQTWRFKDYEVALDDIKGLG